MSSNAEWQAVLAELERVSKDPEESRERRQKAREALKKAEQGSTIRGSNSSAWADRQKNNYSHESRIGGTA